MPLAGGDVAGGERGGAPDAGSPAPRKARTASGATIARAGRERDAGDALGLVRDRRNETDQRAAAIEHRAAARALVHRRGDDRPRLVADEQGRARRKARSSEAKDDKILRRRAEARRLGLQAKSPASIASPVAASARSIRTGLPATVGFGQSGVLSAVSALPGAMTSAVAAGAGRGRGRRRTDAGGRRRPPRLHGALAASGNGSNELATAIATRLS